MDMADHLVSRRLALVFVSVSVCFGPEKMGVPMNMHWCRLVVLVSVEPI